MQDDIDMEPLHKLFIYRKKLVKPYIERLLKWMDGITYMMSASTISPNKKPPTTPLLFRFQTVVLCWNLDMQCGKTRQ